MRNWAGTPPGDRKAGLRLLLATAVLVGLFLMHGLQGMAQHQHPGDQSLSGMAGQAMPEVEAMASMPDVPDVHNVGSVPGVPSAMDAAATVSGAGELDNAPAGGDSMLGLCVALLVGGVLLLRLRRGLFSRPVGPSASTARLAWFDRRRLRPPRSRARTLSILCVSRT